MAAAQFAKTDAGMQALINALDEQERSMNSAHNTVEGISTDIHGHYTSASASTYLSKLADWQSQYQRMMTQVQQVMTSTTHTNNVINQAHDDALQTAQGWSAGADSIYSSLNG